jgi:formate dehydrogenase (NADP+) beta subunit
VLRTRIPDVEDWKREVKCQAACPVSTDAGRYAQLVMGARFEDAYLVARAPNPFASVCGRVCAAPCEDACRRGSIDRPVTIRALKRTLCERFGVESMHPDTQERLQEAPPREGNLTSGHQPFPRRGSAAHGRVAVVGAGPAGLAAAHDLALLGHGVTVFEASDAPGGMMRFGIPGYRLPRPVIAAEIRKILDLCVELRLSAPLDATFGLSQLRAEGFDAIFLSVGVQRGRDLEIPGVELDGVVNAVDFLLNANRGYRIRTGRRVVVIGGGFVAFDAARTALRLGHENDALELARTLPAEADARMVEALDSARAALRGGATEVTIVSLESFEEMPVLRTAQGHEELEEATREGVAFLPRRGPKRLLGAGRLEAVELRRVTAVFDPSGRFAPEYDDADVKLLLADTCVLAIGQRADLSFLRPEDGIEVSPAGAIRVDRETLATTAPGVFAGGDVAFGPRNLIEAIANGKRAARGIHARLSGERAAVSTELSIEKIPTRTWRMPPGYERLERCAPPTLELDRRTGVAEVEVGYDAAQAREQAARCVVCHVQTVYDRERCVLCGRCVDVCPEKCLALVPWNAIELEGRDAADLPPPGHDDGGPPLTAMIKDGTRCIRCGLCARRCPTDAMTMERFHISERYAAANRSTEV